MNFLCKESESKKNICFFLVGDGRGGGGIGDEGARVSEFFLLRIQI